jgi:uncharacterized OB-fold protein
MPGPPTQDYLHADHVLEYDYTRSLGPVLSRFFTELRDGRIVGVRAKSGAVLVPPREYDPETGEDLDEIVPVSDTGVVTTWAWVHDPQPKHPLDHPFAWALVRLEGADTALLHAVDAGEEAAMATGMRVRARWALQRNGGILDLACFEPDTGGVG